MNDVSPEHVLCEVARAVPENCRSNIIVIGSLAAGYHLLRNASRIQVRTKDIDCILFPRVEAVHAGVRIAEQLIRGGWIQQESGPFKPGTQRTPLHELPAVRLFPPDSRKWFIELLTVPASEREREQRWTRLTLSTGHYGLPSFGFLSLAAHTPLMTPFGIYCARPSMMALANLLEHPDIGDDCMRSLFAGRRIKRGNKDLGRVLAIAWLSGDEVVGQWPEEWMNALKACFPKGWSELILHLGDGLRSLLMSPDDFQQAYHTCMNGLLAQQSVNGVQLRIAGERLLMDVIAPVEELKQR